MLEQVLINMLALSDIDGYRVERKPGVWVRLDGAEAKLASIGVRLDHGVTMHGFALNVDLDLSPFSCIVPCGLDRCRMTSMAEVRQMPVATTLVAQQIAQCFADTFNVEWKGSSHSPNQECSYA
jgi:lipoate-protein ligase B